MPGDSRDAGEFSEEARDEASPEVEEFSSAEQLSGKPGRDPEKEGLMHTVLESDSESVDLGNMVMDAVNNGGSMFTPELLMEKLVQDYRSAEQLFGPSLIRQLTGFDPSYVEKNVRIPEFRRELDQQIKERAKELQELGVLSKDGTFTDEALELATVALAVDELDHLTAEGRIGRRVHKRRADVGTREDTKPFTDEPYRGINIAQSVKTAIRRGHDRLQVDDLRAYERDSHGRRSVLFALDASGSMKGRKLAHAKRAGVALAYRAIEESDKAGLLVFGKGVERSVPPCRDFSSLLPVIARLTSGSETDIASCVRHASGLFTGKDDTKHLILLTDALPTVGENPAQDVLAAVSEAVAAGVTVSVVGISLDAQGESLARDIVDLGNGRLYVVKDVAQLDMVVLEAYEAMR